MTNFEKWKAALTANDVWQQYHERDCKGCPASEHCVTNVVDSCYDLFFEWANQEALARSSGYTTVFYAEAIKAVAQNMPRLENNLLIDNLLSALRLIEEFPDLLHEFRHKIKEARKNDA